MSRSGASEPDFKRLFESAPNLYLVLATDFTIVGVNNAYLHATMTERSKIVGRGLFDVFPDNPYDPEADGTKNLRASLELVLKERVPHAMHNQKYDIRRPQSEGGGFEVRYWSPINSPILGDSGEVLYIIHQVTDVTESVRALDDDDGNLEGGVVVIGDITEKKKAEEEIRRLNDSLEKHNFELQSANQLMNDQLVHSQKMEIVGQLAGGIAHDFNNILMVILNCCDFVLEDLTKDDPKFADIMQIHGACNRAISLTKQLLAFSRKQVLNPKILDIDELIQNLRMGLVRTLPASIKLELLTGASGNTIRVDPVRVEQVILNLVINAADAMSEGGRILIETSLENLDEHYAQSHLEALSGNYVLISVSDTGHGMNEDVKRKIFEPFFTTKAPGKGTGLGLSTVYGIVKQSGGSIFVYSELGKGTTFKIYFPVADEMPIETNGSNSIMKNTKGNATILLVEDEPGVRRVAARLLGLAGYTVLEATNGLEGLHFVDKHHDAIRLIVTDVVMPELSGFELCKAVQARYPRIKVIFMSGYNERSVQEQHTQWDPSFRLLQKPFTRESLLSAIETALAE